MFAGAVWFESGLQLTVYVPTSIAEVVPPIVPPLQLHPVWLVPVYVLVPHVGTDIGFLVIVIVEDMAVVVLWLLSPVTFTYTVVVPALVLVGFVVVHVLLSVEYSIVPPLPPLTPIVWLDPSYTPE